MKVSTRLITAFAACLAVVLLANTYSAGATQRGGRGRGGAAANPTAGLVELEIVDQFDTNGDGMLDAFERVPAREFIATQPTRRGPGGAEPPTPEPGKRLSPDDVATYGDEPLYDMSVLRTLFFEFESEDWEGELGAFRYSDVEIPAKLTVDGEVYEDVGVSFRGASSYFTVWPGFKRSLNVSIDALDDDQRLGGHRTLNLLNAHTDPTFLRSVLFYEVSRDYLPAPRANFVRVVINGESWGVYVNVEQFNSDLVRDAFDTKGGARWKVKGNPRGGRGLEYFGEDVDAYKAVYDIKTKDDQDAWNDLIELARVLNQTPPESLEAALEPILDIDGVLRFLASDIALLNGDGYWTRASDYNIYQDPDGRFHIIPHDGNETFRVPAAGGGRGGGGRGRGAPVRRGGRAGRGGRGAGGAPRATIDLDPLVGLDNPGQPLRSKLLAIPALRESYLGYVRDIATNWLDWEKLGPIVERYLALIAEEVAADTRKLESLEDFEAGAEAFRNFAEQRRAFLLN
jgi:spore coat protein CotH